MRNPQLKLLENEPKAYGGELLKTRKGRSHGRPLDTRNTIHTVLRSSKATGAWSFRKPQNEKKIRGILSKFGQKYRVKIVSLANVGNHLHLQIKLANRFTYKPFIRAITGSIAMAIAGKTRWSAHSASHFYAHSCAHPYAHSGDSNAQKLNQRTSQNLRQTLKRQKLKFWDYRPFTRVVQGFKAHLTLRDYIEINQIEGFGCSKNEARFIWKKNQLSWETG